MTIENDQVFRRHVTWCAWEGEFRGIGCGGWVAWKFLNVGLPYHFRWATRGVRTKAVKSVSPMTCSWPPYFHLLQVARTWCSAYSMPPTGLHIETYALCINMLGLYTLGPSPTGSGPICDKYSYTPDPSNLVSPVQEPHLWHHPRFHMGTVSL